MANVNEVLAKTHELHRSIKSLLRLSTFNECDDPRSLDINYEDKEQLFLLDELRSIMDKLSDVDGKLLCYNRLVTYIRRFRQSFTEESSAKR